MTVGNTNKASNWKLAAKVVDPLAADSIHYITTQPTLQRNPNPRYQVSPTARPVHSKDIPRLNSLWSKCVPAFQPRQSLKTPPFPMLRPVTDPKPLTGLVGLKMEDSSARFAVTHNSRKPMYVFVATLFENVQFRILFVRITGQMTRFSHP